MSFRQVKAIVRKDSKDQLIQTLKQAGVSGFNYFKVKGFGEFNLNSSEDENKSYCFDIYLSTSQVDKVKKLIMEATQSGQIGDGIITVSPVEEIIRVRDNQSIDLIK